MSVNTNDSNSIGYQEVAGVLHFNGVPIGLYDDGTTPEQRDAHYSYLISRYTNKWRVYCAHCGCTDKLGNMDVCHTCGDAFCSSCSARRTVHATQAHGKGIVCPSCRQDQRFGIAN